MTRRRLTVGLLASAGVVAALTLRAVTAFSVGEKPLVYRVTVNNNDLDGVEGLGVPGRVVHLSYRQRNFNEGTPDGADMFNWCEWKNGGLPVYVGWTAVDSHGVFRFTNMRQLPTTVMVFPSTAGGDRCSSGIYTELLLQACDRVAGGSCTSWEVPHVDWLNVKLQAGSIGTAAGGVTGAYQAAISVADGPNDGPEPSDVYDVDENGFDTTTAHSLVPGQQIEWRCGAGGTAPCPSIAVHDSSTITTADPEYPFVLGTIQGHRPGGSAFAAAAIWRPGPLGFTVNVNVKFRGRLDVNLGCDRQKFFDFSVPTNF
jgi:hypothetical protein